MPYKFFYDNTGALSSVNDEETGATVYVPGHPNYTTESNPLTAAFLETNPDLSDRPDLVFTPPQEPDWNGLLNQFRNPGNPLYLSIASKVAGADFLTQDHWQNFKTLVFTPELQDANALHVAMEHLKNLLAQSSNPLNTTDISQWNAMLDQYQFPPECRLEN